MHIEGWTSVSNVEVDQSGRMEMAGDTTVAASDGFTHIVLIGKKSPAHRAAIQVTRRQAKADKTPTVEELLQVC